MNMNRISLGFYARCIVGLFMLSSLFSCSSTSDDVADRNQSTAQNASAVEETISLDLEGVYSDMRSLEFGLDGNKITPRFVPQGAKVSVCLAIRSDDQTQPITYAITEWEGAPETNSLVFVANKALPADAKEKKKINVKVAQGTNLLDPSRKWYVAGIFGLPGIDDANILTKLQNGEGIPFQGGSPIVVGPNDVKFQHPVPFAFPWTELKIVKYGSAEPHAAALGEQAVNFRMQGAFLEHQVTNKLNRGARLNKIIVESSVFHSEGAFKFDASPASDLSTPQLFPSWVSRATTLPNKGTQMGNADFYRKPADGVQRTVLDLANVPGEETFLKKDETMDSKVYTWVMPVKAAPNKVHTRVYCEVTPWAKEVNSKPAPDHFAYQNQNNLIFKRYSEVWLSKETKISKPLAQLQNKFFRVKNEIAEPQNPLDRMAPRMLKAPGVLYDVDIPNVRVSAVESDPSYPSMFFAWNKVGNALGNLSSTCHIPSLDEWASVLGGMGAENPLGNNTGIVFSQAVEPTNPPASRERVALSEAGPHQYFYADIRNKHNWGGKPGWADIAPTGPGPSDQETQGGKRRRVSYALRYAPAAQQSLVAPSPEDALAQTDYHLSAWRYEFHMDMTNPSYHKAYVKISSRNLGFGFRDFGGQECTVEDIAKEEFWEGDQAAWDVVRYVPLLGICLQYDNAPKYYHINGNSKDKGLTRLGDFWAKPVDVNSYTTGNRAHRVAIQFQFNHLRLRFGLDDRCTYWFNIYPFKNN
mgnify:FL=1